MTGDRAFWSDSFDMDLPKVIPEARAIVGDLADIVLWTTGHETFGALNHPDVWNSHEGTVAFFGFEGITKPASFVGGGRPVKCTVWEAFRDAWPHHFVLLIEDQPVWNTEALCPQFDAIMWNLRGWPGRTRNADLARRIVRASIAEATARLRAMIPTHAGRIERLPSATPPLVTVGGTA